MSLDTVMTRCRPVSSNPLTFTNMLDKHTGWSVGWSQEYSERVIVKTVQYDNWRI